MTTETMVGLITVGAGAAVILFAWLVSYLLANGLPDIRKWFRRGPGDQFASALESTLDGWLDSKAAEWRADLQGFKDLDALRAEKARLEDRVAELGDEMTTARRDIAREREEVEFQLGLEQRRSEQDQKFAGEELTVAREQLEAEKLVAVREAKVEAREEALTVGAALQTEALGRQEKLIETLTEALPKAELLAKVDTRDWIRSAGYTDGGGGPITRTTDYHIRGIIASGAA